MSDTLYESVAAAGGIKREQLKNGAVCLTKSVQTEDGTTTLNVQVITNQAKACMVSLDYSGGKVSLLGINGVKPKSVVEKPQEPGASDEHVFYAEF